MNASACKLVFTPAVVHPMPETAAFIARLKAAFGAVEIDASIQRGKAGEATFHAVENGHEAGTASAPANSWAVDDTLRNRHYCAGCDGRCVGTAKSCTR
ncbi:hypothetical protein [Paraburkholderia sp.]|uniref:hypothetical protein n=1 Tax=Paraburkholderia sp. TaxID=1926495 RepID=UPI003D6DE95A